MGSCCTGSCFISMLSAIVIPRFIIGMFTAWLSHNSHMMHLKGRCTAFVVMDALNFFFSSMKLSVVRQESMERCQGQTQCLQSSCSMCTQINNCGCWMDANPQLSCPPPPTIVVMIDVWISCVLLRLI